MNNYLKNITITVIIFFWWLCLPPNLYSEFYKYIDEQGRVFYVDDLTKVPEAYRDQIQVYREKYDNLSEQDRSQALQRERKQMQMQEQEKQLRLNEQLLEVQAAEDEEKRRKSEEAKQKLMEMMQTRVIVDGNRILVPVTLVNNGVELVVNLLLDTGASQIVLHRYVADQLNIIALKKGLAQIAGGQNIYVETGQVKYFKVGPFNMQNAAVLIISHEGEAVSYGGLLGMNFLKNVQYTIDYQNQLIRWQPPEMLPSEN
jgi:predicted aspartyl protease